MHTIPSPTKYFTIDDSFTVDVHTEHGMAATTYALCEFFGTWFIVATTLTDSRLITKFEGSGHDAYMKFDGLKRDLGVKL